MDGAEAPYRFYRIPIDTNVSNDIADIVETRLDNGLAGRGDWKVDGYWQNYLWVDLKGCEIRGRAGVSSPEASDPKFPDALSMLIRYQGRAMVLLHESYPNYHVVYGHKAELGDPKTIVSVRLTDLTHDQDFCVWETPKSSRVVPTPNAPRR